jgi:hypothetical protein
MNWKESYTSELDVSGRNLSRRNGKYHDILIHGIRCPDQIQITAYLLDERLDLILDGTHFSVVITSFLQYRTEQVCIWNERNNAQTLIMHGS